MKTLILMSLIIHSLAILFRIFASSYLWKDVRNLDENDPANAKDFKCFRLIFWSIIPMLLTEGALITSCVMIFQK